MEFLTAPIIINEHLVDKKHQWKWKPILTELLPGTSRWIHDVLNFCLSVMGMVGECKADG